MRVKPISGDEADRQANGSEPWAPGEYPFKVIDAADTVSSSGNDMIKLVLQIRKGTYTHTVYDYLVNVETAQWKIRHFAEAVGLLRDYEAGEINARQVFDTRGRLLLKVRPPQGEYAARNVVADYLGPDEKSDKGDTFFDDECPF